MQFKLSSLDTLLFSLTILITIAFIVYGHHKKKVKTEKENFLDLILMGRQLTLPLFVATLVATWYGGIFGVAQIAFEEGIFNFVSQGIFWYLTYALFAFFILNKIKKYEAVTLPDLVGKIFGEKSRVLAGVFNVLNLIPIVYTISLGALIKMFFDIELNTAICLGTGFVVLYSFWGGFRSVVYSDLFQFFIMIFAVVIVFIFSVFTYDFSMISNLPSHYFHPLGKHSVWEAFAWGLIALSTLVDPNFYQRCFAAKDFKIAKKGILISTVIWIIFDLSLTFGAMYARAVMPQANPGTAYFEYAFSLLPNGLTGIFLAGIFATILSTLDSYIFLAGSTLSYDLAPKKVKGKVLIHYFAIIMVGVFSVVLATIFEGNIKNVWKTLGSISSSALLIPVLSGHIMKRRLSDWQFVIISSTGALATIYWRLSGLKSFYQVDEIYIGMSITFVLIILIQLKNYRSDQSA